MKRKTICIICKKERKGARVLDDIVISNIRKIKQKFGIAQNNILVVCDECMPAYKQKRATFEKYFVVWAGLAFLILIFHLLVSPTLTGIAFSILLIILFSALSLIRYSPRVEKHG
jgi:predicted RND superfamily exporter protein